MRKNTWRDLPKKMCSENFKLKYSHYIVISRFIFRGSKFLRLRVYTDGDCFLDSSLGIVLVSCGQEHFFIISSFKPLGICCCYNACCFCSFCYIIFMVMHCIRYFEVRTLHLTLWFLSHLFDFYLRSPFCLEAFFFFNDCLLCCENTKRSCNRNPPLEFFGFHSLPIQNRHRAALAG